MSVAKKVMEYKRILNPKTKDEKFLSYFIQGEKDECWEWRGPLHQSTGYGSLNFKKEKTERVHRYSYKYYKGSITNGLCVLHTCDNRKCINHNHLWLGTRGDNFLDCIKKGRHPIAKYGRE